MNIQKAVQAAIANNGYIRRKSIGIPVVIQPTNTPECCKLYRTDGETGRARWNPKADDLLADDWEVFKTIDEFLSRTGTPS